MRGRLPGKFLFNRLNIVKSLPSAINHETHHTSSRAFHQCREHRFNAVYQATLFQQDKQTTVFAQYSLFVDERENVVQRMT